MNRRSFLMTAGAAAMPGPAKPVVAMVHGEERRKNVREALVAIDAEIRPRLKRKKYVLIKPNGVAVKNQLGSTHADALRGILDYLDPRWKGPVVIAESSRDNTWDAVENFGWARAAAEYKRLRIKIVDLNEEADRYRPHQIIDKDLRAATVRLAGRLFDPDAFLIGAAIPKAHDYAVATLSVKNFLMAAPMHNPGKEFNKWHDKFRYHAGYKQMHLNLLLTAKIMQPYWGATVIDGYEGMEGAGPLSGTPVPSRFALASTDLVAADRVGIELMGIDPKWVGYLNYCAAAGLGEFDLSRIELRSNARIDELKRTYKLHPRIQKQLEWMS